MAVGNERGYKEGADLVDSFDLKLIFEEYFENINFTITAQRQAFYVFKHFCGHHALLNYSEFLIINYA